MTHFENQLKIVSSVIMMHKQVMAARVIDEDVAEILFASGKRYYLHYGTIGGEEKFAISDDYNCLVSVCSNGAEAVSWFVNHLKTNHRLLAV